MYHGWGSSGFYRTLKDSILPEANVPAQDGACEGSTTERYSRVAYPWLVARRLDGVDVVIEHFHYVVAQSPHDGRLGDSCLFQSAVWSRARLAPLAFSLPPTARPSV